jgi:hypothetical protein
VVIGTERRPVGKDIEVSGKREARQIAEQWGAQPWNF